jgi:hypothetical protein
MTEPPFNFKRTLCTPAHIQTEGGYRYFSYGAGSWGAVAIRSDAVATNGSGDSIYRSTPRWQPNRDVRGIEPRRSQSLSTACRPFTGIC